MEASDLTLSPCILVLGAKEHTLEKLKAMPIRFVLLQTQDEPVTIGTDELVVFTKSYENLTELSLIAKQLHQTHQFKAVVSFTEFGLYPAAVLAQQLNLKGNAVFPVEHTRDKLKMRCLLDKHQLSTINYQHCNSLQEVEDFYKKIQAPFILKPAKGAGSQGVYYVDSRNTIPKAWNWATAGDHQELIAEEYLLGPEYSVETLSFDGQHQVIAITEKRTTGFPHFIELGHYSPARLPKVLQLKVKQLIDRFLHIIQHQNGPAHTEIKIHHNEIRIIESQTRMGGDHIWELTELTTGVDVVSQTIEHLLGLDKKLPNKKTNAAAILFFARELEEIIAINGLKSAQQVPGIIRIHCALQKGQRLGKLKSSLSRQGYVLGVGHNVEEAIFAVNLAMNKITVKTKIDAVEN